MQTAKHFIQMAAAVALLLTALMAAQVRAADPFHGMGMVFDNEGTMYMEAEDGTVYLLEGIDMAPYEGLVVIVDGMAHDSSATGPVLVVTAVTEMDQSAYVPDGSISAPGHL